MFGTRRFRGGGTVRQAVATRQGGTGMSRRRLIAGNWKMNGTSADLGTVTAISMAAERHQSVDVALCLPATLIHRAVERARGFTIGGQDVHASASGAHTGCTAAA